MQPDLLQRIAAPLRLVFDERVSALVPGSLVDPLRSLVDVAGLAAVGFLLAAAGRALTVLTAAPSRSAALLRAAAPPLAGVVATGLFAWLLRNPSAQFEAIFARWDHLAFCASAGVAATAAPAPWRKVVLAGLSLVLLLQYYGAHAVALVAGTGLLGFALVRTSLAARPWALAAAQGGLVAAAYGYAFWVRSGNVGMAVPLQGLLAYTVLRHVSFVVEAAKTPRRLSDYATFMSFYPGVAGVFGAPEVYAEFSRRNLTRAPTVDYARAARRVAFGSLQIWLALRVSVSVETVLTSPDVFSAWVTVVAFFLRTALAVMGAWAMIEGCALFLGVQLRTNFQGLLTCQNPSELWWAWRGSLTNWLVQHVYGPLGGRRHLSRNILAAFAVSFVWHAIGVPFLTADFRPLQLVPVAAWAVINGAAVLIHANLTRHGSGAARAGVLGRGVRIVLMWVLGAMTPLLLSFQGDAVARFPALLGVLSGTAR